LADICKSRGITAVFTSLSSVGDQMNESERSVSSLMDTWISLSDMEANGERNRVLYILKSRGMNHSKQLREYELTDDGIHFIDAYIGSEGVLTGTARLAQEAKERQASMVRQQNTEKLRRELVRKREATERHIAELHADLAREEDEVDTIINQEEAREAMLGSDRSKMAAVRGHHHEK
jgi:circadian clock protein KaiC